MKTLVLVVALISAVTAQYMLRQDDVSRLEAYRRSCLLQRLRSQSNTDALELRPVDSPQQEMKAAIKKKCDQYGDKDAFINVERALDEFKTCVERVITYTPQPVHGDVHEAVSYACRLAPQVGSCVTTLGEAAKPCMPPKRRQNFLLANLTHSVVNYVCDNNGARLKDFIAGDGQGCVKNNAQEMVECAQKLDTKEVVNSVENSIESGEVTESDCQKSDELRKCVENKLSSCPNQAAENFFKGLFDVIDKLSPCSELEQREKLSTIQ